MRRPSNPSWLDHDNNIWWRAQIMALVICSSWLYRIQWECLNLEYFWIPKYKYVIYCPIFLSYFSPVFDECRLSVIDLLRWNSHWWCPVISSTYGVNF
jgi:hypothetical protein